MKTVLEDCLYQHKFFKEEPPERGQGVINFQVQGVHFDSMDIPQSCHGNHLVQGGYTPTWKCASSTLNGVFGP